MADPADAAAVRVRGLTRRYRSTTALDGVDLELAAGSIHGLLGRNGAGKSSLMSVVTGQEFQSSGEVSVFGQVPHENESVLPRICFIRESMRYTEDIKARHAFKAAADAFPNWDWEICERLAEEFQVPERTKIKKMSHGQRSAVGVITGLASRADLTLFDEPYVGLDPVARSQFYRALLEDYTEHPRTIIVSSHLIDEIAHLIENVVLLDRGQVLLHEEADALRDRAVTLVGRDDAVDDLAGGRAVLTREAMGRTVRLTVEGHLSEAERQRAAELEIDVLPVGLQDLVVHLTTREQDARGKERQA
ncbi:ABC transporter ATP-binding protein [Nesterenkonia populi]|uniref:ABC transporter ATP-binding protein n=1 Tax=Nesterenkonia populi TaxID=1591087 RepID=UPI0011BFA7C6|nr:ABC transporter ATP-binding protein [Nesterenkonia populi]